MESAPGIVPAAAPEEAVAAALDAVTPDPSSDPRAQRTEVQRFIHQMGGQNVAPQGQSSHRARIAKAWTRRAGWWNVARPSARRPAQEKARGLRHVADPPSTPAPRAGRRARRRPRQSTRWRRPGIATAVPVFEREGAVRARCARRGAEACGGRMSRAVAGINGRTAHAAAESRPEPGSPKLSLQRPRRPSRSSPPVAPAASALPR